MFIQVYYQNVFNRSLSFSWIKVKALRENFFVQFGNLFFLSYFLLLFSFIRVNLNSVRPKDAAGPVFARPTEVLCVYTHDLCVNANSASACLRAQELLLSVHVILIQVPIVHVILVAYRQTFK